MPRRVCLLLMALLLAGCFPAALHAQNFIQITDPSNPIVSEPGAPGFNGCAWVDYDVDGDEDLFVNPNQLYRNDGDTFVAIADAFLPVGGLASGCSWADYDNDGDPDLMLVGNPCTLYRNDEGVFTAITEGDIGRRDDNSIRGWAAAWGDYDNDGNVDVIITHAAGYIGTPQPNHQFHNDGPPEYNFTRITDSDVTTGITSYTVGTWSDYDLDGDYDFAIGAGPASGTPGPDFLYRNILIDSGRAELVRVTGIELVTTLRDGQVWNWIDYDNDRDLDVYITNWGANTGSPANELYRHDGELFTRVTTGAIVTDADVSLGSAWADFDNDGDLDAYVTNNTGISARYYSNNGDGTFSSQTNGATVVGAHRGASAGDYDNDGDMDLFVNGNASSKRLFRNDLASGNHWAKFYLTGMAANRAAIGAKVWMKATLNGAGVWQLREISAQNGFNSHNSLVVHFGLRDATQIDSVIVDWPGTGRQIYAALAANADYFLVEGEASGIPSRPAPLPQVIALLPNYPNPFNPTTQLRFELPAALPVTLTIYNTLGQHAATLVDAPLSAGRHQVTWNAQRHASGLYLARLRAGDFVATQKLLLMR